MKSPPHFPSADGRHTDPVVRAASDWLVARDRGLTAEEKSRFEAWVQADPRHAEVYRELEDTWSLLAEMPDTGGQSAGLPIHAPRAGESKAIRFLLPLAAAAAIVVGSLLALRPIEPAAYARTESTAVGGGTSLTLPDGSMVQLNTDTSVEIAYTAGVRRVRLLRGEAHFRVAKLSRRPFVVSAANVDVRAVGTAFNVHWRNASLEVLVTEGRVAVAAAQGISTDARMPSAPSVTPVPALEAGDRAVISLEPIATAPVVVAHVAPEKMVQLLAWRERQLQFVDQPLSEIANEFNRYNRHKLSIADPRLGRMRFGGTFPADDYTSLVRLLQTEFGVVLEERPGGTLLSLPP